MALPRVIAASPANRIMPTCFRPGAERPPHHPTILLADRSSRPRPAREDDGTIAWRGEAGISRAGGRGEAGNAVGTLFAGRGAAGVCVLGPRRGAGDGRAWVAGDGELRLEGVSLLPFEPTGRFAPEDRLRSRRPSPLNRSAGGGPFGRLELYRPGRKTSSGSGLLLRTIDGRVHGTLTIERGEGRCNAGPGVVPRSRAWAGRSVGREAWAGRRGPGGVGRGGVGREAWAGRRGPGGVGREAWAGGWGGGVGREAWAGRGGPGGVGREAWAGRRGPGGVGREAWAGRRGRAILVTPVFCAQTPPMPQHTIALNGRAPRTSEIHAGGGGETLRQKGFRFAIYRRGGRRGPAQPAAPGRRSEDRDRGTLTIEQGEG